MLGLVVQTKIRLIVRKSHLRGAVSCTDQGLD
jgi:hypothetical protein